ncbi:MAG TPA: GYD domain-containing protein [Anaerolineae bacterium]
MSTYLLFCKYSPDSAKSISPKRTTQAMDIVKKYGGEFKTGYALLGEVDLVLVVDLPDTEKAMQTSAALTKLLGISITTAPAVMVEQFDKLMG